MSVNVSIPSPACGTSRSCTHPHVHAFIHGATADHGHLMCAATMESDYNTLHSYRRIIYENYTVTSPDELARVAGKGHPSAGHCAGHYATMPWSSKPHHRPGQPIRIEHREHSSWQGYPAERATGNRLQLTNRPGKRPMIRNDVIPDPIVISPADYKLTRITPTSFKIIEKIAAESRRFERERRRQKQLLDAQQRESEEKGHRAIKDKEHRAKDNELKTKDKDTGSNVIRVSPEIKSLKHLKQLTFSRSTDEVSKAKEDEYYFPPRRSRHDSMRTSARDDSGNRIVLRPEPSKANKRHEVRLSKSEEPQKTQYTEEHARKKRREDPMRIVPKDIKRKMSKRSSPDVNINQFASDKVPESQKPLAYDIPVDTKPDQGRSMENNDPNPSDTKRGSKGGDTYDKDRRGQSSSKAMNDSIRNEERGYWLHEDGNLRKSGNYENGSKRDCSPVKEKADPKSNSDFTSDWVRENTDLNTQAHTSKQDMYSHSPRMKPLAWDINVQGDHDEPQTPAKSANSGSTKRAHSPKKDKDMSGRTKNRKDTWSNANGNRLRGKHHSPIRERASSKEQRARKDEMKQDSWFYGFEDPGNNEQFDSSLKEHSPREPRRDHRSSQEKRDRLDGNEKEKPSRSKSQPSDRPQRESSPSKSKRGSQTRSRKDTSTRSNTKANELKSTWYTYELEEGATKKPMEPTEAEVEYIAKREKELMKEMLQEYERAMNNRIELNGNEGDETTGVNKSYVAPSGSSPSDPASIKTAPSKSKRNKQTTNASKSMQPQPVPAMMEGNQYDGEHGVPMNIPDRQHSPLKPQNDRSPSPTKPQANCPPSPIKHQSNRPSSPTKLQTTRPSSPTKTMRGETGRAKTNNSPQLRKTRERVKLDDKKSMQSKDITTKRSKSCPSSDTTSKGFTAFTIPFDFLDVAETLNGDDMKPSEQSDPPISRSARPKTTRKKLPKTPPIKQDAMFQKSKSVYGKEVDVSYDTERYTLDSNLLKPTAASQAKSKPHPKVKERADTKASPRPRQNKPLATSTPMDQSKATDWLTTDDQLTPTNSMQYKAEELGREGTARSEKQTVEVQTNRPTKAPGMGVPKKKTDPSPIPQRKSKAMHHPVAEKVEDLWEMNRGTGLNAEINEVPLSLSGLNRNEYQHVKPIPSQVMSPSPTRKPQYLLTNKSSPQSSPNLPRKSRSAQELAKPVGQLSSQTEHARGTSRIPRQNSFSNLPGSSRETPIDASEKAHINNKALNQSWQLDTMDDRKRSPNLPRKSQSTGSLVETRKSPRVVRKDQSYRSTSETIPMSTIREHRYREDADARKQVTKIPRAKSVPAMRRDQHPVASVFDDGKPRVTRKPRLQEEMSEDSLVGTLETEFNQFGFPVMDPILPTSRPMRERSPSPTKRPVKSVKRRVTSDRTTSNRTTSDKAMYDRAASDRATDRATSVRVASDRASARAPTEGLQRSSSLPRRSMAPQIPKRRGTSESRIPESRRPRGIDTSYDSEIGKCTLIPVKKSGTSGDHGASPNRGQSERQSRGRQLRPDNRQFRPESRQLRPESRCKSSQSGGQQCGMCDKPMNERSSCQLCDKPLNRKPSGLSRSLSRSGSRRSYAAIPRDREGEMGLRPSNIPVPSPRSETMVAITSGDDSMVTIAHRTRAQSMGKTTTRQSSMNYNMIRLQPERDTDRDQKRIAFHTNFIDTHMYVDSS